MGEKRITHSSILALLMTLENIHPKQITNKVIRINGEEYHIVPEGSENNVYEVENGSMAIKWNPSGRRCNAEQHYSKIDRYAPHWCPALIMSCPHLTLATGVFQDWRRVIQWCNDEQRIIATIYPTVEEATNAYNKLVEQFTTRELSQPVLF